jgi:hypothetical protein
MKMKKLLFFFIIFISPYISIGQIVLDQADLPQIGDVQVELILDSAQSSIVLPGTSGANQVWDFSSLPADSLMQSSTTNYVNPATTPNGSSFPGATIAKDYSPNYLYYISNSSGMKVIGYAFGSINLTLEQYPLEFPLLTYGNSMNHACRVKSNIISSVTYDVTYYSLTSTADAWGTITTPVGTMNAIRIYTTETDYDSSYVNGVGTQNSVSSGKYYYNWYAKNLGWPILTISNKGLFYEPNFKEVRYASDLSSASVTESLGKNDDIKIYPNPATSNFTILIPEKAIMEISNMEGQLIKTFTASGNNTNVDISSLPCGVYIVKVKTEKGIAVKKFIKE